jgi:hypothetical protein
VAAALPETTGGIKKADATLSDASFKIVIISAPVAPPVIAANTMRERGDRNLYRML